MLLCDFSASFWPAIRCPCDFILFFFSYRCVERGGCVGADCLLPSVAKRTSRHSETQNPHLYRSNCRTYACAPVQPLGNVFFDDNINQSFGLCSLPFIFRFFLPFFLFFFSLPFFGRLAHTPGTWNERRFTHPTTRKQYRFT